MRVRGRCRVCEVRRGHCGGVRVSAVGQVAGEDLSACSGVVTRCLEEAGLLLIHFTFVISEIYSRKFFHLKTF